MFCPQSIATGAGCPPSSSAAVVIPIQKPSRQSSNFPPNYGHQIQQPNPSAASSSSNQNCHCICERPMALVVCRRCGNDLVGRVLSPCPMHPRRIALMDLRECPRPQCRSVHLAELQMPSSEE